MPDVNVPYLDQRGFLIVDDNPAIHRGFKKILCGESAGQLEAANAVWPGSSSTTGQNLRIDGRFTRRFCNSATQGNG